MQTPCMEVPTGMFGTICMVTFIAISDFLYLLNELLHFLCFRVNIVMLFKLYAFLRVVEPFTKSHTLGIACL